MGVRDEETIKVGPWPAGINNVAREFGVPADAVREAHNVDFDNAGRVARRSGSTRLFTVAGGHSMWSPDDPRFPYILAVHDNGLHAYSKNADRTLTHDGEIRASVGPRPVSYTLMPDGSVVWTNKDVIRRITPELEDAPLWIGNPGNPTVSASSSGGMTAGDYLVALTWMDAEGRESGAGQATVVTLAEGQGVTVSGIPANADATHVCVFVSEADGDTLRLAQVLPMAQGMTVITAGARGRTLETQFLDVLEPGDIVVAGHGRLYVLDGPFLRWSESVRYGLAHYDNWMRFGDEARMCLPVGDGGEGAGCFVSDHKRVYFMAGADPSGWRKVIARPKPAIPGTACQPMPPGTAFGLEYSGPVGYWIGEDGTAVIGMPGGIAQGVREGQAVAEGAHSGASVYRERDGLRQIITSLFTNGTSNGLSFTDSAVATVRRHDAPSC